MNDTIVASPGRFSVVAQRTSFDITYAQPWKVEEYRTIDEAIERADTQNKGLELFELNDGMYTSPNFKHNQAFYVYDDKGKLLRKPEDVYPEFVPLGT